MKLNVKNICLKNKGIFNISWIFKHIINFLTSFIHLVLNKYFIPIEDSNKAYCLEYISLLICWKCSLISWFHFKRHIWTHFCMKFIKLVYWNVKSITIMINWIFVAENKENKCTIKAIFKSYFMEIFTLSSMLYYFNSRRMFDRYCTKLVIFIKVYLMCFQNKYFLY